MVLDGLLLLLRPAAAFLSRTPVSGLGAKSLVTYHPETLVDKGLAGFEALLAALEGCLASLVFTYPNADVGSEVLLQRLLLVKSHSHRCWAFPSLGQDRYLRRCSF